MKSFYFTLFLLLNLGLNAQNGYIDTFPDIYYSNLIVFEDTLILMGISHSDPNRLYFAKKDTLGKSYIEKLHLRPDGKNYFLSRIQSKNLVKFEDNSGYLFLAALSEGPTTLFIKFDNKGNIMWEKEHQDSTSNIDMFAGVIEVEDGFLLGGDVQLIRDFKNNQVLLKISKEGKLIWRKDYGDFNFEETSLGITKNDDESIMIFGVKNGGSLIRKIDLKGNEIQKWESQQNLENCCVNYAKIDRQNRLIQTSRWIRLGSDGSFQNQQPIFTIRDSAFNVITQKIFGDTFMHHTFNSLIPIKSGGWLAVGRRMRPVPVYWDGFAWLVRFDENGDTLWTTEASVLTNTQLPDKRMFQDLNQAVELSSGSIIASGNFEFQYESASRYGFLIKVDKNGCWDTIPCRPITSNFEIGVRKGEVQVYPNHTSAAFGVYFSEWKNVGVNLYNSAGQLFLQKMGVSSGEQIEVGYLPKGLYFYQMHKSDGEVIDVGKIVIGN